MRGRGRLVGALVALAVVGVVFVYVLPKIAGYGKVWRIAEELPGDRLLLLAGLTLVNLLSFAPPWVAALPRLGFVHGLRLALGPSAISVVAPASGAVSMAMQFGMLRSWGLDRRAAALAAALVNVWGQLAAYGFPVVAVMLLALDGGHNHALLVAAVVAALVFAAMSGLVLVWLWSAPLARRVGDAAARAANLVRRLVNRGPVGFDGASFVRFRSEALSVIRRRGVMLTVATLVSQGAVFALLLATLRAVGVGAGQVDLLEAFAAWSLIRTLGKIPITPAGFGVEEIALVGALIGFGARNAPAVSATLIYRFLTVVPPLVIGLGVAATYRVGRPTLGLAEEQS